MSRDIIFKKLNAIWYAKTGNWDEALPIPESNSSQLNVTDIKKGLPESFDYLEIYQNEDEPDLILSFCSNPIGTWTIYWSFGFHRDAGAKPCIHEGNKVKTNNSKLLIWRTLGQRNLSYEERDRLYLKETFGLTDQEIEDLDKDDSQKLPLSAFQKPEEAASQGRSLPLSTLEGHREYLRETFGLSDQEIADLERRYLERKVRPSEVPPPSLPPQSKPLEIASNNSKRSRGRDVTQEGRAFQIIGTSMSKPNAPQANSQPVKKGDSVQ